MRDLTHKVITATFTATVITYDPPCETPEECTCTNVYGEWCEHGYGQTMATGYWDPNWSLYDVSDSPNEVTLIDTGDPYDLEDLAEDYDGDLEAMVTAKLEETLGPLDSHDGDTAYASDPLTDYRTGAEVLPAGHIKRETYHVTKGQLALLEI